MSNLRFILKIVVSFNKFSYGQAEVNRMWRIDNRSLLLFNAKARRLAITCEEACGVLVRFDRKLILVPVANMARSPAAFLLERRLVGSALMRAGFHKRQMVGTYHSHPISVAEPGPGDIAGASDFALMLISNSLDREVRLWQIESGVAVPCLWCRA